MISIQTNLNSLVAQQNLSVTSAFQSRTISQLTSGYRINQSGDDAAGLAVANKFRSTVAELTQGVANGNDATAQLQIMDGGMSNISAILDRLKTLATQSASGTFTGSRITLNSEFQNDITEIDRQAQSVGLDTGGTFAKALNVYLGQGSGSASLVNAQVGLDLSAATVDAQSLGMKGMQAVTGSADLSASSATSVARILTNASNQGSESLKGFTTFQFSGPGFDSGTSAISVNLNNVSGINALVTSINSAIQSTGKSNASFQSAGIVASVHTDAANRQQLAFTSGTTAFQVQAGDQMANALMGNFSNGSTGASLQTKVIGQATAALGNPAGTNTSTSLQMHISGGGLAAAQDITLTAGTTLADLVKSLSDQIGLPGATASSGTSAGAAAKAIRAAGISVALDATNHQLVFTNSSNSPFKVQVGGDTANLLGLGSSLANATATYTTITAGASYSAAGALASFAVGGQATLEFSVNNGPAVALAPIALDGGNASASKNMSRAIGASGLVVAGNDELLQFAVDGNIVSTKLAKTTNDGKAVVLGGAPTSTVLPYTVPATTLGGNAAASLTVDATASFDLSINGGAAQHIDFVESASDTVTIANINDAIKTAFGGVQVVTVSGAAAGLRFTAADNSSFTLAENGKTTLGTDLKVGPGTYLGTGGGAAVTATPVLANATGAKFDLTFDGVKQTITFDESTDIATTLTNLNDAIKTAFNGVQVVTASGNAAGLTFSATNLAPSSSFIIQNNVAAGNTVASVDFGLGNAAVAGANLKTYANGGTNGGNNSLNVGWDGTVKTVTLTGADRTLDDLQNDLQRALNLAFKGDAAIAADITVGKNLAGTALTLTTTDAGRDKSITLNAAVNATTGLADTTLTDLGFADGTNEVGAGYQAGDIVTLMNAAIQNAERLVDPSTLSVGTLYNPAKWNPTITDAATVSVNELNQVVITNNSAGADHTISGVVERASVISPGAWQASALWDDGTDSGTVGGDIGLGQNRDLGNLIIAINLAIKNNAPLNAAGLEASDSGGKLMISSTNGTSFQLNAGAATAKGTAVGTADLTSGFDFGAAPATLRLLIDGTTTKTVTLNQAQTTAGAIKDAIKLQLGTAADASVVTVNGKNYLTITSATTGPKSSVQVLDATGNAALGLTTGVFTGANEVNLGFGVTGKSFVGNQGIAGAASSLTGVSASGTAQTGGITFAAMAASATGTQALTISANDGSGNAQSTTITLAAVGAGTAALANDGTAGGLDAAVKYINQELQKTNNSALQAIVAVQQNVNGTPEINFLSSGSHFQVAIGTGVGVTGLNGGVAAGFAGETSGSGSTLSIDSQAGAQAAITALASAVGKLGSAQAAIGRGENQLAYAISLAQSQITNFSAAESQIRDANVAQQAANLSKAQVLSQASIAAMAQANSAPQAVLSLLRG